MKPDFDLQHFMEEMRKELNGKLDAVVTKQNEQETRIAVLEANQNHLLRIAWGLAIGIIVGAWNVVRNVFTGK